MNQEYVLNSMKRYLLIYTLLSLCALVILYKWKIGIVQSAFVEQAVLNKSDDILKIEPYLCYGKVSRNSAKEKVRRACPSAGIITVRQGGRLGNQIFEYASAWALARLTGLDGFAPLCMRERLYKVFENLSLPAIEEIEHCSVNLTGYVTALKDWTGKSQSIVVPRSATMPEEVLQSYNLIRQEFKFKHQILDKSATVLAEAAKLLPRNTGLAAVFVGVHVRRTDYTTFLKKYHIGFVGPDYFLRAMDYFDAKYRAAVFVVTSDDPKWCMQHLAKGRSRVYVASQHKFSSAEVDLAVLAGCNYSIIDYGTYGIWGALMTGGETVFYNLGDDYLSSRIAKILPYWRGSK